MSRTRALLAVPLLVLVLSGCVPTPEPTGPSGDPTGPAVPIPTSTATATPTPGPDTEPVDLACSELLDPQAVYDYNPNVTLLDAFAPDAGSLAGDAVAQQGVACRLVNQTSGETIDVGVVRFTSTAFDAKKSAVAGSATAAGSFDGYFDSGVAQAFAAPYWVTVTSSTFEEAADAEPIVSAVLSALG